jgi:putative endonuclease
MLDKCFLFLDECFYILTNNYKMLTEKKKIGNKGEEIAAQYLENKGYRILCRNWTYMKRELDIVAQNGNELVFVEVKTRSADFIVSPAEAVTPKKQRLLVNAANMFVQMNDLNFESRFDIVSVVYQNNSFRVEHIENAFYPQMR